VGTGQHIPVYCCIHCRIITTLLDKPEIGPHIIDDIILDIFRTLYHMSQGQDSSTSNQVFTSNKYRYYNNFSVILPFSIFVDLFAVNKICTYFFNSK
jgi:hypothetical protein